MSYEYLPVNDPQYQEQEHVSMMSSAMAAEKRTGRKVAIMLIAGMFVLSGVVTFFALYQGKHPKELKSSPVSLVTVEPEGKDSDSGTSGAVARIEIGAMGSDPDALTITPGTTVAWRNNDSIAHNISGDEMGSDHVVQPGETLMFVYSQPGEYSFIDNGLMGTITVSE